MDTGMIRFMWRLASSDEHSLGRISVSCNHADLEVHAPGAYASLQQWIRMFRPGRQLL